jgi:hypothetical protein
MVVLVHLKQVIKIAGPTRANMQMTACATSLDFALLELIQPIARQSARRHRRHRSRHLVIPTLVAAKTIRGLLVEGSAHFMSPAARILRAARGQLGIPGAHARADQLQIRPRAAEVRATTPSLRQIS